MKNDLSCEVVRDLLPSYIDSLTSEVTNEAMKTHLSECEDCRKAYEMMSSPEDSVSVNDEAEVNFLKAQKKKAKKAVICGIGVTVALALAIVFMRIFVIGAESNPNSIVPEVTVEANKADISGIIVDSANVVSDVTINENGDVLEVFVKERAALFPGSDRFKRTYEARNNINEIYLNGKMIWQNGISLSPGIGRIMRLKHPYVGDASANSNLARELGLYNVLGECTMELKTANEPYGWIIESGQTFYEEQTGRLTSELPKYGTILLALIDNLDYVEFHYKESIDGHETIRTLRITSEDATAYAGGDIKKAVGCEADLQRLIEKLNLTGG